MHSIQPRLLGRFCHVRRVSSTLTSAHSRCLTTSHRTTPSSAVSDQIIADLAPQYLEPLALGDLVKYGRPPIAEGALFDSANFSLKILPSRLARRIQALRNLPYIVVTNPHIAQIHNNYMHSLASLLPFAEKHINNLEDEDKFTDIMAGLVQTHNNTIPVLARGFLETRKYISPEAVKDFLDVHLRARIGTRLIAEQHIALHYSTREDRKDPQNPPNNDYVGIIDTALRPARILEACETFVSEICELSYGVRPSVKINGHSDTTIIHIPMHLEYILTELLKNAFRATIENGNENHPIEITVAPATQEALDLPMGIVARNEGALAKVMPFERASPGVTIRIRDRGGGISPEVLQSLWNYGFTTFNDRQASDAASSSSAVDALNVISGASAGGSSIAGLGYGLPLGRAYAEYFGGGIAIQSLYGWGTDVYLSIRGVGQLGG